MAGPARRHQDRGAGIPGEDHRGLGRERAVSEAPCCSTACVRPIQSRHRRAGHPEPSGARPQHLPVRIAKETSSGKRCWGAATATALNGFDHAKDGRRHELGTFGTLLRMRRASLRYTPVKFLRPLSGLHPWAKGPSIRTPEKSGGREGQDSFRLDQPAVLQPQLPHLGLILSFGFVKDAPQENLRMPRIVMIADSCL